MLVQYVPSDRVWNSCVSSAACTHAEWISWINGIKQTECKITDVSLSERETHCLLWVLTHDYSHMQ